MKMTSVSIMGIVALQAALLVIANTTLNDPQNCTINELGDANSESWSENVPFQNGISATLRSTRKDWQEFSFGFESKNLIAIGYLKFKRDSNITVALHNSETDDLEELHTLPIVFQDQLLLEDWTDIILNRSDSLLTVRVNGIVEITVPRVNVDSFKFVYALVPDDQYIEVGFGCNKGTDLVKLEEPAPATTNKVSYGGIGTIAAVVIAVLLLVAVAIGGGSWYRKKMNREQRQDEYRRLHLQNTRSETKVEEGEGEALVYGADGKVATEYNKMENEMVKATPEAKEQIKDKIIISTNRDEELRCKEDATDNIMDQDEMQSNSINDNVMMQPKTKSQTSLSLSAELMAAIECQIEQNEPNPTKNGSGKIEHTKSELERSANDEFHENDNSFEIGTEAIELETVKEKTHIPHNAGNTPVGGIPSTINGQEIREELCVQKIIKKPGEKEDAHPNRLEYIENISNQNGSGGPIPDKSDQLCMSKDPRKLQGQNSSDPDTKQNRDKANEIPSTIDAKSEIHEEVCVQKIIAKPGEQEGMHPNRLQEIENDSKVGLINQKNENGSSTPQATQNIGELQKMHPETLQVNIKFSESVTPSHSSLPSGFDSALKNAEEFHKHSDEMQQSEKRNEPQKFKQRSSKQNKSAREKSSKQYTK